MEKLTKPDFWTPMMEAHPELMKKFCGWIDEYKKSNNWKELFGAHLMINSNPAELVPKFHELPSAMQLGIFMQFAWEHDHLKFDPGAHITSWFIVIEEFPKRTPRTFFHLPELLKYTMNLLARVRAKAIIYYKTSPKDTEGKKQALIDARVTEKEADDFLLTVPKSWLV